VASHVVDRLSDPELLKKVRDNGEWLGDTLRTIARRSGRVRAVRGMGYMWGLDVVDRAADVVERGWAEGLLMVTAGDHTVRLLPPLVTSQRDLERGTAKFERALSA
jgi:acetylornithine/N-succinyldiaminopimelate aminotransferase